MATNYRHTILSDIVKNKKGGRCLFRGVYMRNIVDIIPNKDDICSNADMPKLGDISAKRGNEYESRKNKST